MHTPDCDDSLEFWPEGAGTDVDVSTLPAANAITNPRRIPGEGQWLGFWGPSFSGLRVGYSPTRSYPVINGLAVPYPVPRGGDLDGLDVFLSRDTGGTGIVTIARFKTEEAARAWGGRPTPGTSAGGGILPARTAPLTMTRVGGITNAGETALVAAEAARVGGPSLQCVAGGTGVGIRFDTSSTTVVELAVGQLWEPPPTLLYTGSVKAIGLDAVAATVAVLTF